MSGHVLGRPSSRQILYFPLTDEDKRVRRTRLYRVGRRAHTFSEHDPNDDLEVADLKRVVLAPESTDAEREAAIQGLLARGSLARYRVSLVVDVLLWLGTAVVVFVVFALLVWLF